MEKDVDENLTEKFCKMTKEALKIPIGTFISPKGDFQYFLSSLTLCTYTSCKLDKPDLEPNLWWRSTKKG